MKIKVDGASYRNITIYLQLRCYFSAMHRPIGKIFLIRYKFTERQKSSIYSASGTVTYLGASWLHLRIMKKLYCQKHVGLRVETRGSILASPILCVKIRPSWLYH